MMNYVDLTNQLPRNAYNQAKWLVAIVNALRAFGGVARAAKGLNVSNVIGTAPAQRNNVVTAKVDVRFAALATHALMLVPRLQLFPLLHGVPSLCPLLPGSASGFERRVHVLVVAAIAAIYGLMRGWIAVVRLSLIPAEHLRVRSAFCLLLLAVFAKYLLAVLLVVLDICLMFCRTTGRAALPIARPCLFQMGFSPTCSGDCAARPAALRVPVFSPAVLVEFGKRLGLFASSAYLHGLQAKGELYTVHVNSLQEGLANPRLCSAARGFVVS